MKKLLFILLCVLCASVAIMGCFQTEELNDRRTTERSDVPTESVGKEQATQNSPLTTNVQQLIADLGSDDWETREKAQKKLEDWPAAKIGEIESAVKEASENKDPEIRMRANQILKVIEVKKRVQFSDGFLKEFPDIYRNLLVFNAQDKFKLLEISARDKYSEKITNQDIAGLIGEILLFNDNKLTVHQKEILLVICSGSYWGGGEDAIGWSTPITGCVPYIIKLLNDEAEIVRLRTADVLGIVDAKIAIPQLRELLKDKSSPVRREVVHALGDLGDKESIPQIIELLRDEDGSVREYAASALGKLAAKESIPALLTLLQDESCFTRGFAAISLVELDAKNQIPKEAIEDIKSIFPRGSDSETRARAALKELGVEVEEGNK